MSDHQHESYDVYGLDGTRQDARESLALAGGLREDLGRAEERIGDLEDKLARLEERTERELRALWAQTPDARQAQYEADVAAAGLAASGYDRHGRDCGCGYCCVPGNDEDGAS